ncbi:hypothetical protein [Cysteiniphilum sp. 6C5]
MIFVIYLALLHDDILPIEWLLTAITSCKITQAYLETKHESTYGVAISNHTATLADLASLRQAVINNIVNEEISYAISHLSPAGEVVQLTLHG